MKNQGKIGELLALIAQDKDGRKNLDAWLRNTNYAMDIVCKDIDDEMKAVKPSMKLPTADLTADLVENFSFDQDIVRVMETKVPTVSRVLYAAAQDQAIKDVGRKKSPRLVS